ncbi:MAG TPA: hypothetical protein VJ969_05610, partial [Desulfopila sp.]|nr:hypothetical protein [Desulfopila sp.]
MTTATIPRLGEMLLAKDLIGQQTLDEALRIQVGGNRRLGTILVRMKTLSEDQLAEVLAEQLNIDITDIDREFTPEVSKTIPRYLCKKYDVIPLKFGSNNTLVVAMADPSDAQTIGDLEQYTGRAVDPRLARQSDIAAGIKKHIPVSLSDILAPQTSTILTRAAVVISLVLVILVGAFSYNYIHQATYGTVSETAEATIYKNHDLMIAYNKDGNINLLGRGAYADGYYSISFNNSEILKSFITSRSQDLSEK